MKQAVILIILLLLSCKDKTQNETLVRFDKGNGLTFEEADSIVKKSLPTFYLYNPKFNDDTLKVSPKQRIFLAKEISNMLYEDQYYRKFIRRIQTDYGEIDREKRIDSLRSVLHKVDEYNIRRYIDIVKKYGYTSPERFFVQNIDTIGFKYNLGSSWLIFHHSNPLEVYAEEAKELIKENFIKGRINNATFSALMWNFGGRTTKGYNNTKSIDSTIKLIFPKKYNSFVFNEEGFLTNKK